MLARAGKDLPASVNQSVPTLVAETGVAGAISTSYWSNKASAWR